eukprot:201544_1
MSVNRVTRSSSKRKLTQSNSENKEVKAIPEVFNFRLNKHYSPIEESLSDEQYNWSCKCKGKLWKDSIENECYGCDMPGCINYECALCLKKNGYDTSDLTQISKNEKQFLCQYHQYLIHNKRNRKKIKPNSNAMYSHEPSPKPKS